MNKLINDIKDKKNIVFFSIIFSFLQVIGYNCDKYDSTRINSINTYLNALIISIIIIALLILLSKIKLNVLKIKYIDKIMNNKYLIFILIILSWVIPLIALYPGNFAYDAGSQLRMVQFNILTKYHPVIHTMFLYIPIVLIGNMFKSYDIGLLLHSILQMTIMASIFTITLRYLYKKKFPSLFILLFLLLYMFLPTHSVFSISTTKDVIFSGLFNLVFICIYELSTNTEDFLSKKKNIIITIILLFLLFTFRNNMIYSFIIFIPFILILLKKYSKKILIICLSSVLLFGIYDISLSKVFKINNGPRIEMFGFVVQQFARVYNKENLNSKEKKDIESLFKNNSLAMYNSHITDPVKSEFDSEKLLKNKNKYLKLYLKLGLKYPLTYVDSIMDTIYGFFYFGEKLPQSGTKSYMGVQCLSTDNNTFATSNDCNNNFLKNHYYNLLENANYQKIPVLNILMSMALYVTILLFVICKLLAKKEYKKFIPILLIALYILTNILAPVAVVRYMYPLFTTCPLILLCLHNKKEN